MTLYAWLLVLHVILFAYWLGADLGVHLAARFAVRADLPFEERMRFLTLILLIDLGPEAAICLLVPLGFQMAAMAGYSTLDGGWLWLLWLVGVSWYAVICRQHLGEIRGEHTPLMATLKRVDSAIRYAAIGFTAIVGVMSLTGDGPLSGNWLAIKVLLYALALVLVSLLRWELSAWGTAIAMLQKPETVDDANAMIMRTHLKGRWYAWSLWTVVAAAALFGIARPV